jgi:hypothetical protein
MRQFWPSILLLFISQAFLFNYSHSQTTLIVASSKASKPCDNPPCDPVISDPINSGSHSEVGLISTCYQADSALYSSQLAPPCNNRNSSLTCFTLKTLGRCEKANSPNHNV